MMMVPKKIAANLLPYGAILPIAAEAFVPRSLPFVVVGIVVSSGSVDDVALLLSTMPATTGIGFVVLTISDGDARPILSHQLQLHSKLVVVDAQDGMKIQPDHLYVIPPGSAMTLVDGVLTVAELSANPAAHVPQASAVQHAVDSFFTSLAQEQCDWAVALVLSGSGCDTEPGVRAIKAQGGLVIAQQPESARANSLPLSAIATGLVDYILSPETIFPQLWSWFADAPALALAESMVMTESVLSKIFILLRAQTGHDFSYYKPGTIHRRILRRMVVHQIYQVDEYVTYLEQATDEVEALFRDLLIGVTNFFRDPEVFQVLEQQIIPKLFSDKEASGGVIRVWSTGCSTGEEAYSVAILLQEYMEANKLSYTIQVFATDIDSRAIAVARAGFYPASIAGDITAQRLSRYFTAETDGCAYRIQKVIRDMLIFSEQNVIKDPPFSRLDLISCRNLMIYLGTELQKKLIPLFHYALNPGGILFLGTSEGVGDFTDMFTLLDRKAKLYQRRDDLHGTQNSDLVRFLPFMTSALAAIPRTPTKMISPTKLPLRELTEQMLLQQIAPVGILTNGRGDILYLHGRTGIYLELQQGEQGMNNILKLAREGLRRELGMALHKAVRTQQTVSVAGLSLSFAGLQSRVNLCIRPVSTGAVSLVDTPLYLVILENSPVLNAGLEPDMSVQATAMDEHALAGLDVVAKVAALKDEIRAKDEYLKSAHEELERSNEELKSANEEMQSVNEELQSTNEELETSKEEL